MSNFASSFNATKRRFFVSSLVVILFGLITNCSKRIIIPSGFFETNPPEVGSKNWLEVVNSPKSIGVDVINGKLEVKEVEEVNTCNLPFSSGTLKGINEGEWGGSLIFKPDDSAKASIKIKSGNVMFIFNFQNKPYFIEGLAHMGYSGGALFEIDTTGNRFSYKKRLDFEDAPQAFAINDERLLIACTKNFFIVKDFKKELIFANTFWDNLYPNSMAVIDDKNVFLGVRGGIVRLDLIGKQTRFYKYKTNISTF